MNSNLLEDLKALLIPGLNVVFYTHSVNRFLPMRWRHCWGLSDHKVNLDSSDQITWLKLSFRWQYAKSNLFYLELTVWRLFCNGNFWYLRPLIDGIQWIGISVLLKPSRNLLLCRKAYISYSPILFLTEFCHLLGYFSSYPQFLSSFFWCSTFCSLRWYCKFWCTTFLCVNPMGSIPATIPLSVQRIVYIYN